MIIKLNSSLSFRIPSQTDQDFKLQAFWRIFTKLGALDQVPRNAPLIPIVDWDRIQEILSTKDRPQVPLQLSPLEPPYRLLRMDQLRSKLLYRPESSLDRFLDVGPILASKFATLQVSF